MAVSTHFISGCLAVPYPVTPDVVTTHKDDLNEDIVLVLKPKNSSDKFSNATLDKFSNAFSDYYKNIEIIDNEILRETISPDETVELGQLLENNTRERINNELGIHYMVILGKHDSSEEETGGFNVLLYAAWSGVAISSISAKIIDMQTGGEVAQIDSKAEGSQHVALYIVIVAGTAPLTYASAVKGLAKETGKVIEELAKAEKIRIAILPTETSLTDLKEKQKIVVENKNMKDAAKHDSQWMLSKRKELRSKYKELCEAAEQGDYHAQWELGYLHANGLYGVRKDLVLSAMWYGLVESAGHHTGGIDTIREQLTPEQLTEVERLSDQWMPGQCEQKLFENGSHNIQ